MYQGIGGSSLMNSTVKSVRNSQIGVLLRAEGLEGGSSAPCVSIQGPQRQRFCTFSLLLLLGILTGKARDSYRGGFVSHSSVRPPLQKVCLSAPGLKLSVRSVYIPIMVTRQNWDTFGCLLLEAAKLAQVCGGGGGNANNFIHKKISGRIFHIAVF